MHKHKHTAFHCDYLFLSSKIPVFVDDECMWIISIAHIAFKYTD